LEYWKDVIKNRQDDKDNNEPQNLLYLKDWHFVQEYPEYEAYTTPPIFSDDWISIFEDSILGDQIVLEIPVVIHDQKSSRDNMSIGNVSRSLLG
jgi:hypothetical protein